MIYFTPNALITAGSITLEIENLKNPGFSNSAPFVINGLFNLNLLKF